MELLPLINEKDEVVGSCTKEEVFLARYHPRMGEVILNEEQIKGVWVGKEKLITGYRAHISRFSVPFRLTCEKLLDIS